MVGEVGDWTVGEEGVCDLGEPGVSLMMIGLLEGGCGFPVLILVLLRHLK